jgi:hypothetical protein
MADHAHQDDDDSVPVSPYAPGLLQRLLGMTSSCPAIPRLSCLVALSATNAQSNPPFTITLDQLRLLLDSRRDDDDDNEDDDDDDDGWADGVDPSTFSSFFPKVTEPVEAGVQLAQSGDFGPLRTRVNEGPTKNIARLIRDRTSRRTWTSREEYGCVRSNFQLDLNTAHGHVESHPQ